MGRATLGGLARKRAASLEDPSVIVTCQSCDTPFEVEESTAPEGGARLVCPECEEPVSLGLPGDEAEAGEEILEGTLLPEDDFVVAVPESSALSGTL